ncbi:hypothetical protein CU669_18880 [Paramagnetospirillum kuznetsovii]|uniref:DUF2946 domain-containing protein n=1 Tax=Paramagnetospirillum kuznetsovii TaxID=2053833 RepID=A0A364NTA3_9PROT|nr:DUF2946 family protein [Paramagnetospirillum kuznetsovii]RAU20313.1 hypothetical protein CU669_18880 [Paramagnetospirillum kuznetsovii]
MIRAIRWLSLIILLLNILAGSLLAPGSAAAGIDGERIVVCTAGGMVVLDSNGQPSTPRSDHGGFCAFCLPLLHVGGTALAPEFIIERPQPLVLAAYGGERSRTTILTLPPGAARPRAPPLA